MATQGKFSEAYELILTRKSIREFSDEPVSDETVKAILMAGRQAPSGMNNQPWRFVIVQGQDTKMLLAGETAYGHIIAHAPLVIPVFIDQEVIYDTLKDHLGIGACIENMLLAAHSLGLGGVWLGEILKNKEAVRKHLGLESRYELMAVLALGYPKRKEKGPMVGRKPLNELILKKFV